MEKLRYTGYTLLARGIWAIKSIKFGRIFTMAEIVAEMAEAEAWINSLPSTFKNRMDEQAKTYMKTERFFAEEQRFIIRKTFDPENYWAHPEDPFHWFWADMFRHTDWPIMHSISEVIDLKITIKKLEQQNQHFLHLLKAKKETCIWKDILKDAETMIPFEHCYDEWKMLTQENLPQYSKENDSE